MGALGQARNVAANHQFAFAISLTVLVTLVMTAVSLYLYSSSGAIQLDLSRPGYEMARKEIIRPDNNPDFASYGAVDVHTIDDYQQRFDAQRTELNRIGKFKDKTLDDESLAISGEAAQ